MKPCLIDLDGVCADFTTAFKRVLDRCHGAHLEIPLPPDEWYWDAKYYGEETSKMAWDQVRRVDPQHFWSRLPALDLAGLARLSLAKAHRKINPYFVTNRNFPDAEYISERWLESYTARPKVISTQRKDLIARAVGAVFYVEDRAENAQMVLREMGTACKIYLVKYPYNKDLWHDRYIIPVNSLNDALVREGL